MSAAILYAIVDRDGQFARGVEERPDRLYITVPTIAEIANRDLDNWDREMPKHAPHSVRRLVWQEK